MTWHVKIYLAPFVQQELEEFDLAYLAEFHNELIRRAIPLSSIRVIRITPIAPKE